jgi:hypothetical protein
MSGKERDAVPGLNTHWPRGFKWRAIIRYDPSPAAHDQLVAFRNRADIASISCRTSEIILVSTPHHYELRRQAFTGSAFLCSVWVLGRLLPELEHLDWGHTIAGMLDCIFGSVKLRSRITYTSVSLISNSQFSFRTGLQIPI